MIKKITILLLTLIFLTSCGYSTQGYMKSGKKINFYVESVSNNGFDNRQTPLIKTTIEKALINYNELTSPNVAAFFLAVRIDNIKYSPLITSPTDETITSNALISITYIVTDRRGREVFSKSFTLTRAYNVTGKIVATNISSDTALKDAILTSTNDFRLAFYQAMR